jgi:hypothetical protein
MNGKNIVSRKNKIASRISPVKEIHSFFLPLETSTWMVEEKRAERNPLP